MNYIELINNFWQLNKEFSFTPNEKALYFTILNKCNELGWKNPFNQSNAYLALECGVTEPTLIKARNTLQQKGLIEFKSEKGRRNITIYTLKTLNNFSISDSISDSISQENLLDNNKHINKTKLNNSSFLEKEPKIEMSASGGFPEKSETDLKTENELSKKVAQKKVFNFQQAMTDAGFDPELSAEWLKIRKAKKAVNSEIAFKNFLREVEKSGRSPNEVLALVVQKQWKGFEASWLHNEQKTMSNEQRTINNNSEPKFGRTSLSEVKRGATGWE